MPSFGCSFVCGYLRLCRLPKPETGPEVPMMGPLPSHSLRVFSSESHHVLRSGEPAARCGMTPLGALAGEDRMRRTAAAIAALAVAMLTTAAGARAQEWPTRPVTMVVPFAAGGPVDVLGRILAQYLAEVIGKQVIVDNVPGGGGMSGSLRVSQATPDGHTFVLGSIGTHALNQTLSRRPLYNPATDFAPVALIADVGLVLIARKDLPADDLEQFVAYDKANQAEMPFG